MLEQILKDHLIDIKSVINFRDIGGFVTKDGYEIKRGLLFRSGPLDRMTPEDVKRLSEELKITQIVDFRTANERKADPDAVIPGAENTHLNVYGVDDGYDIPVKDDRYIGGYPLESFIKIAEERGGLKKLYSYYAEDVYPRKGYTRFFEIVAGNDTGGTLWHCTQGKDRTGLGAAFLMTVLGVDRETILDEYETTNIFYADILAEVTRQLKERNVSEEIIETVLGMFGVNRGYLMNTFRLLEEQFGSAEDFIKKELGVTDRMADTLKKRYLR